MYEKHKGHGRILCVYVMYYVDMSFSQMRMYVYMHVYIDICMYAI